MTTLILLFHEDFAKSKANRALVDAAREVPLVEIVDVAAISPGGEIDTEAAVAQLTRADRLVLQFPIQWYSTPPLLKAWQDSVLTRMFYIHAQDEGERLRGLPVMVAATAGNEPSAYTHGGMNLFPVAELLKPLHATAHRCAWEWSEPFVVYRANKSDASTLAEAGQQYAARLRSFGEQQR